MAGGAAGSFRAEADVQMTEDEKSRILVEVSDTDDAEAIARYEIRYPEYRFGGSVPWWPETYLLVFERKQP